MVIPLASSIQDIFSFFKKDFVQSSDLSYQQLKVLNHITACRTPSLGGFISYCTDCGAAQAFFHSCGDRHCPVCQGQSQAVWAENQMQYALPLDYFHIVFTLPDSLNSLFLTYFKVCADALFHAASKAILTLCKDKKYLNGVPAVTAVLHTWGQTVQFHPHLHVIVSSGGLSLDGKRAVSSPSDSFFLPVKVLSRVFRGIFLRRLKKLLSLEDAFCSSLYNTDFFLYLKAPFDSPSNIVKYLARYTHRVAITDARILSFDQATGLVSFSFKDNKDGGKQKVMTLHGLEFMRRFFLHVLPKGFVKIRHSGLLANHNKKSRIAQCIRLLGRVVPRFLSLFKKIDRTICPLCGAAMSESRKVSALFLSYQQLLC